MTDTNQKIRTIVERGLAPSLKQAGFRRHGDNFSRKYGEALHVVNFQRNKWNTKESGKFTLNVGAHFPSIATLLFGKDPMPANPKEVRCLLRVRVGLLMPDERDHWWDITPQTSADDFTQEMGAVCSSYIFPWLEQFKTVADTNWKLRYGIVQHTLAEAAANIILGNRTKAAQCLEAEVRRINDDSQYLQPDNVKFKQARMVELRKWAANQELVISDVPNR